MKCSSRRRGCADAAPLAQRPLCLRGRMTKGGARAAVVGTDSGRAPSIWRSIANLLKLTVVFVDLLWGIWRDTLH